MHIRVYLVRGESGRNPQLADSRPSGRLFYYRFEVIACTLQSVQAASPMLSSPQMRRADASARVRPIDAPAHALLCQRHKVAETAQPPRTLGSKFPRCLLPERAGGRRSTQANSEASNLLSLCTKMTISYEGIACYSPCAMNMWSISSRFCFNRTVFGTDRTLR